MVKIFLKTLLTVILLIFFFTSGNAQSKRAKVKISISEIPAVMTAGSSHDIIVTFYNVSNRKWTSDKVDVSSNGLFAVEKISDNVILSPFESGSVTFRLTAPRFAEVYDFTLTLYDKNKKVAVRKKIINVEDNPLLDGQN